MNKHSAAAVASNLNAQVSKAKYMKQSKKDIYFFAHPFGCAVLLKFAIEL